MDFLCPYLCLCGWWAIGHHYQYTVCMESFTWLTLGKYHLDLHLSRFLCKRAIFQLKKNSFHNVLKSLYWIIHRITKKSQMDLTLSQKHYTIITSCPWLEPFSTYCSSSCPQSRVNGSSVFFLCFFLPQSLRMFCPCFKIAAIPYTGFLFLSLWDLFMEGPLPLPCCQFHKWPFMVLQWRNPQIIFPIDRNVKTDAW